jgi:hypothetical protein
VGYATSNANLRGLGANSTLILLNGRRMANQPFGSIGGFNASASAVDLNSIPFSAIERVEVLRDGASAVYGTDCRGWRDQLHHAHGLPRPRGHGDVRQHRMTASAARAGRQHRLRHGRPRQGGLELPRLGRTCQYNAR